MPSSNKGDPHPKPPCWCVLLVISCYMQPEAPSVSGISGIDSIIGSLVSPPTPSLSIPYSHPIPDRMKTSHTNNRYTDGHVYRAFSPGPLSKPHPKNSVCCGSNLFLQMSLSLIILKVRRFLIPLDCTAEGENRGSYQTGTHGGRCLRGGRAGLGGMVGVT